MHRQSVQFDSRKNQFIVQALLVILSLSWASISAAQEPQRPFTMAAVGDSITAGVNSTGWGAQVQDSWSTGDSPKGIVDSHFVKLQSIIDGPIRRINVARGGASSQTVDRQIDELVGEKLDYVTFFIGANDVCRFEQKYEHQLQNYEENIRAALTRILSANPNVKILLLQVPNLFALWEVGKENKCQWLWDATGLCGNLLHSSRSQEQRESFKDKVVKVNRTLESLAAEFPEHIRINPDFGEQQFGIDDLSPRDCFHPSGKGQNLISTTSWKKGWYGSLEP